MRLLFCLLLFTSFTFAQKYNIKDYGANGNGSFDNSTAIQKAIADIKTKNGKKSSILYIPAGNYLISQPIILNKYVSIEGEGTGISVIKVSTNNSEGIILEDNKNEKDIYQGYNTINNLSILGPDFDKNPYSWKDIKQNNPKSVGIKVLGLRNRISNCIIDGFLWSGIQIEGSYYNYITQNFIKNNRIGITIDKNSTSAYINNNELRINSIGLLIQDNSYANFINNNMIESNLAHFLDPDKSEKDPEILTAGKGIVIINSFNNYVENNYFEQHFTNIVLKNAKDNIFNSNFIALGNLMPEYSKNQNILRFEGKITNNVFSNNTVMGSNENINTNKMILSNTEDYSTNKLDFGKAKNDRIKIELKKSLNNKLPQIP
ncbi:glycosyl hydrolase family 28-related protein [Chryseobacterium limigenitum]|uniref:Pectate lyase superfamily protein n=1 Tax=Chryseobacterium limigenitum TaxID=1612149 RepID=A0A1K2IIR6_9FLAO|nr:glycosyl hydrolase family 28-related protein [Chryseobacterium limigenitum]SFZ92170.1 Pectate lyase superfamily protein [Chryseobacterium limigenitum]